MRFILATSQFDALSKRVLDLLVSCCILIVFIPVFILICGAIKSDSKGPVLFSQIRIGQRGKIFKIYKFRKFFHSTTTGELMVTAAGDKRMTRVGRILQRTKLDELPQLWNVLRGDMSIVGPRPETVEFADCFVGDFERLLDFKPGLTGPSQVLFRDEAVIFEEHADPVRFYRGELFGTKARVDLSYFSKANILLDLWWLIRSIHAVVLPRRYSSGGEMLENAQRWIRKNASMLAPGAHESATCGIDGWERTRFPRHRRASIRGLSLSSSWTAVDATDVSPPNMASGRSENTRKPGT
jgi:lipopolysaccharide/colanic/teichoic acid biosynthesis glycosyltransferase